MNWTKLLKMEIDSTYRVTARLLERVTDESLEWKPEAGSNWMTMGQLIQHLATGCGWGCRGFVTGEWGLPEGKTWADLTPEENLPPAEKMPASASVAEGKRLLEEDRVLALAMVDRAGEERLALEAAATPWAPGVKRPLGVQLLRMVQHLDRHKSQLFYYLKLEGVPVNTTDLWDGP
ncbi:MAG TPA: DinB family protein [Acidobacteriaceae bacterium]|nr:DinB family protein [Acidobacteriaceae bacterium]